MPHHYSVVIYVFCFIFIYSASSSVTFFFLFFFLILRPPPTSTLFPYTTLFRSAVALARLFTGVGRPAMLATKLLPGFTRLNRLDRKSTRLNSSHVAISYAVFCLKKKNERREREHEDYASRPLAAEKLGNESWRI